MTQKGEKNKNEFIYWFLLHSIKVIEIAVIEVL